MKNLILLIGILVMISSTYAGESTQERYPSKEVKVVSDADYSINLRDNTIILTPSHGRRESIKITPEYELFLNDHRIQTNDEQQKLIAEYYDRTMELLDMAKDVGLEGAKIGAQGAALGVKAVGSVFKLILPGYDTDDLEREINVESAKIEAKASKLEARAKKLEKEADALKEVQSQMKDAIPELENLDWF